MECRPDPKQHRTIPSSHTTLAAVPRPLLSTQRFESSRRPSAAEPLMAALTDVDSDVRRGAAVALVEIDPKWAKAEAALRAVSTAATPLKGSGTDTRLGVLFDIDKLGGGLYGYRAYKVFLRPSTRPSSRGACSVTGTPMRR